LLPTLLATFALACGSGTAPPATQDTTDAQGQDADPLDTATPPRYVAPTSGFKAIFLDVGQGDAILLVAGTGETMLVDGGKSTTTLVARLEAVGLDHLDAILATHADYDHIGGLLGALERYDVKKIYWNGGEGTSQTFETFYQGMLAEGAELVQPRRGESFPFGNVLVHVLNPKTISGVSNADSIVVRVGCPGSWLLLTGDAENSSELEMMDDGVATDIDVLKVSHHGANTATTQVFLDITRPENAVISAGLNNQYGHPSADTVKRLEAAGSKIWQVDYTDGVDGVVMTSDCSIYALSPL